jgi:hypothetical protein
MTTDAELANALDAFQANLRYAVAMVVQSPDPHTKMRELASTIDATVGDDVLVVASGKSILTWLFETVESLTDADLEAARCQLSLDRIIAALRHRAMHHPSLTMDWDHTTKH